MAFLKKRKTGIYEASKALNTSVMRPQLELAKKIRDTDHRLVKIYR